MLANPQVALYQLTRYYNEKVEPRKGMISKTIHTICKMTQEILKEVETQEPRFISTLVDNGGQFDGVYVTSPTELDIVLYLNQMGVFNFVDDGSIPGCAVLKLSDGRKRSMSLWVEFITASGYLSARKIRSRFQTLVAQAIEKSPYRDVVTLIPNTSEVKLRIHDKYIITIVSAFRCTGIWPRSACHWPQIRPGALNQWPPPDIVTNVKNEGFDLYSRETTQAIMKQQQNANANNPSSMEGTGDAWGMSFVKAEDVLLQHGHRKRCYSILKTLRDSHLDFANSPIDNYILKTLLMFECEKHANENEWGEIEIGDRIIGIFLQLVSCLQCRRCPHYFIPSLDLLRGKPPTMLNQAAKATWHLVREIILNPRALERL